MICLKLNFENFIDYYFKMEIGQLHTSMMVNRFFNIVFFSSRRCFYQVTYVHSLYIYAQFEEMLRRFLAVFDIVSLIHAFLSFLFCIIMWLPILCIFFQFRHKLLQKTPFMFFNFSLATSRFLKI